MIYIVAILLPPLALLMVGKFWAAVFNFLMCCTLFLWPVAIIHAWIGVKNSSGAGNKNINQITVVNSVGK